ncbi:MAG: ParB/RepB/Spo0J family partition protein [Lachnospiraceae bacterium]|nr:ParB/RepB/Spo0J family partition protein [Lachnospiraceae bacterium]
MAERKTSFYDSLFGFEDVTVKNARKKGVPLQDISPEELKEFEGHPFKVQKNAEFEALMESIKKYGLLEPVVARKKGKGYEIISGHRRTMAAKTLGLKTIPVLLLDLDDDMARIMVVDANKYRKKFYPSELAFAFKMRLEAENHRGKLSGNGENTAQTVGKDYGLSRRNVYNYIKLTGLLPELLNLVDDKKIGCSAAIELADLNTDMQSILLEECRENDTYPDLLQARQIKEKETFDRNWLRATLLKQDTPKKEKFKLSDLDRFFPEEYTDEEKLEKIEELLDKWNRERTQMAL